MIALDVQNTALGTNLDMTMFWLVICMSVLWYICTFLPFGVFYTEVNEERDQVSVSLFRILEMAYVQGNEE